MRAPAWLHDVLGEEPSSWEIAAILAFALPASTLAIALAAPAVAGWRLAVAWLLLADIAAGCVANFTRSTNDFYAARPRNRWAFIAVHAHLPAFAWLVGASPQSAWGVAIVWGYTIIAASAVNLLAGRERQIFVAGLLLSMGLVLVAAVEASAVLRVAEALFLTKVAFSFAVDHFRTREIHEDGARSLGAREHDEATAIIARAFARDPLFVAVCGDDSRRRVALASFLLDMTTLTGGAARALSQHGKIVAVSLVDRPTRVSVARYVAVFFRFVPTLVLLGARATKQLNDYFVRTRREVADREAYLVLLAVDPTSQGRGLGGQMIHDATEIARSMGAATLSLDTENESNVTLYERFGFSLCRELPFESMRAFVMSRAL